MSDRKVIASISWGGPPAELTRHEKRRAEKEARKTSARNRRARTISIPLRFPKLKRPSDAGNGATVMQYINEDETELGVSNRWTNADGDVVACARAFAEELELIPGFGAFVFDYNRGRSPEEKKIMADVAEGALRMIDD